MVFLWCAVLFIQGGLAMSLHVALQVGVNAFTFLDLLKKAASFKNLTLQEGSLYASSTPVKRYVLDEDLLGHLALRGIKRQDRPDCNNKIFTLVDENSQVKFCGQAPSNCWNFTLLDCDGERLKFDLCVDLSVGFGIDTKKRGVSLYPQVRGTFVSAADQLPKFRMFEALVEHDGNAPLIAKELVAAGGELVVGWTSLGLAGIRSLVDLFGEFADRRLIKNLAHQGQVFDPPPFPPCQNPADELFVIEPIQPGIFEAWREQVNRYATSLVAKSG